VKHKPKQQLQQIFQTQIDYLAITLRPNSLRGYRASIRNLLRYLAMCYPQIHTLEQLRRDPHILGWIRHLAARDPALSKTTRRAYLLCVRRLLMALACSGRYALQEGLIVQTDLPRPDHYLPKPLSPENDHLLQQHLRAQDELSSNALLLLRHTGIRIGELLRLPTDCLRHVGGQQWALHVPLGKLHTERWVPADEQICQLYARLLLLRQEQTMATHCNLLLPYRGGHHGAYCALSRALKQAAQQAGCSQPVTPHRLRHTYATEMLRAGASLPAVMHLLGHNTVTMTLRYVQVTQNDLQREYRSARQNMATLHAIPELPSTLPTTEPTADLTGILKSLTAMHHLVEMFRRRISDEQSRHKIARLANRLVKISTEFRQFIHTP
jgi:site-specific recombinase XerD